MVGVGPAPFREAAHRAEPGTCCLCGQPVYWFGWHRDLWRESKPVLAATRVDRRPAGAWQCNCRAARIHCAK